ncbi:Endonuclease/exonuclease/phosphatase, partial [Cokeromyces recurvatus]|uniref:Endonuclease/exonuclease/phosphatase n=1 Tax=Cokeromyces recurvatus TaxID=90255 RepID=UPI0022209EE2
MRVLNIACINANGKLQQEAIDSALYHCKTIDLLFITETWLPPDKSIPTHWKQFHIYGSPVPQSYRFQMGISLFINPTFNYTNIYVDTQSSPYYMLCHIDNIKIYCLYLPPHPSLHNTTALQLLSSIPLSSNTILCGDINARMGKQTGDSRWNTRGSKFAKYIQENNLYNWNAIHQYGTPTRLNYIERNNSIEKSIVDYFLTQADLPQSQLQIKTDLSVFGSDHKLMIFSFLWDTNHLDTDELPPTPVRQRWKIHRLKDPHVQSEYIKTLQSQFYKKELYKKSYELTQYLANHFPITTANNTDTIETLTESLYDCLYYTLDTVLTPLASRPKTWKWFWNKQLQALANHRQACYTRWRKSTSIQRAAWWSKYKTADQTLKSEVKKARATAFHNFCDELDSDPIAAMPTIKRIVQAKTRSKHIFSSDQGPQQAVTDMAIYLEGVYDGKHIPQTITSPQQ